MTIGCAVMAAGSARRFGGNKLAAVTDGKMLIQHALDAVPPECFCRVAVVTQYPEIEMLAVRYGFQPVRSAHPDQGISRTIRLGLDALEPCGAAMFLVADQPFLRRETVVAEVDFYLRHPDNLVALGHNGVHGNPCIFPARFFPALRQLRGDCGGSSVIRANESDLLLLETPACELEDIDTPDALRAIAAARPGQSPRP